jgi:guanylate kinase
MRLEREGVFYCLSSPAGAGKTTLSEAVLKDCPVKLSRVVTCTSRERRPQEVEGVSYHFLGRERFEEGIAAGHFFEWEEVHGNLYGTRQSDLEGPEDRLLVIDIRGALTFKERFPERTVLIIVVPPRPEDLRFRLLNRGTEGESQVQRRLETARQEYEMFLSHGHEIDYLIVNDDLSKAIFHLKSVIVSERLRYDRLSRRCLETITEFDNF